MNYKTALYGKIKRKTNLLNFLLFCVIKTSLG